MATLPSVRQEGDFWQALFTSGSVPERLRGYGMDNMGVMSWITRDYTKFASMLHKRFNKSKTVTDREHRVHELTELDRIITVTTATAAANNHTTFGIADNQAAMLQPNDMLIVRGLYAYVTTNPLVAGQVSPATNAVPTTPNTPPALGYTTGGHPQAVVYGRTWGEDPTNTGNFFVDYEQVIVTNVGAAGSAGGTNTLVTVRRFFAGPGARDFGGAMVDPTLVTTGVNLNNAGALFIGDQLLRAMPSWREGTGPARGFHKNPVIDNNFTQEFKYAVETTTEAAINKTYMKDPLTINRLLRMKQMGLDYERTLLFSRKGKVQDTEGKAQYTMGGIVEYIPKDNQHILRHTAAQITYPSLLRTVDQLMKNGGSSEKVCPIGTTAYTNLKIAYYDSGYMRYDEEASKEFDMPIESIIGAGVKLMLVPSQTMEESGYANKMLCLDFGVNSFTPVTHTEWDMKFEADIQQKGDQIYKEQWVGMKGLERRYAQYQAIISFD